MEAQLSPGARFRAALVEEKPLQVVGVINAYAARLAEKSGFRALYLSGGGVAAASLGVPDLGITTLEDARIEGRRIAARNERTSLLELESAGAGAFNIARA